VHFGRLGRVDIPGYWIAAVGGVFIPWNASTLVGVLLGGAIPDATPIGLDVVFPAAMLGLAAGLVGGRRDLVAAGAGAGLGVALSVAIGPALGIVAGGLVGPLVAMAIPASPGTDVTAGGLPRTAGSTDGTSGSAAIGGPAARTDPGGAGV
jgi:predicted branched-subunit amino acid permease